MKNIFFLFLMMMLTAWALPVRAQTYKGLVGWWKLDDGSGTTAVDSSGNGNTGTLSSAGAITWVTGKYGDALNFSGSTVYVSTTNVVNTATVTVSLWLKVSQYPNSDALIAGFSNGNDGGSWDKDLIMNSSGKIYFYVYDGSTKDTSVSSAIPTNTWTHIVGTADGTHAFLYVNGVQVGSVAAGNTYTSYTVADIQMGGKTETSIYMEETIDDYQVYSRALTPGEVYELFESGAQAHMGVVA